MYYYYCWKTNFEGVALSYYYITLYIQHNKHINVVEIKLPWNVHTTLFNSVVVAVEDRKSACSLEK